MIRFTKYNSLHRAITIGDTRRRPLRLEWLAGRQAYNASVKLEFHEGENDQGLMLSAGLPFLFKFFLSLDVLPTGKPWWMGIYYHDNTIVISLAAWTNESNSDDPWWRKTHCVYMPWDWTHESTEVKTIDRKHTVWIQKRGDGKKFLDTWDARKEAESANSITVPYVYRLKSGEVQERIATVHVIRMVWKARWPWLRKLKVVESIEVTFSDEVGEKSGSWKGGCIGCGYDLLPDETAEQCLRRMESERKF